MTDPIPTSELPGLQRQQSPSRRLKNILDFPLPLPISELRRKIPSLKSQSRLKEIYYISERNVWNGRHLIVRMTIRTDSDHETCIIHELFIKNLTTLWLGPLNTIVTINSKYVISSVGWGFSLIFNRSFGNEVSNCYYNGTPFIRCLSYTSFPIRFITVKSHS